MNLLDKYLTKSEFESYEDFAKNYELKTPDNFNFAFDVVDYYAENAPEQKALVWCDDEGGEEIIDFAKMSKYSKKAANVFKKFGIQKGDHVILTMKSRFEFWYCILGLHRIGAIAVPATHMLKPRDIVYRIDKANLKMAVCANDESLFNAYDNAVADHRGNLNTLSALDADREGWVDFNAELEAASDEFERPEGDQATRNDDVMLGYFSSGTSGYPKMVQHNFAYPLGHIITAKYWQNVQDGGLHYTVADSGWAKCAWGKLYGQWLCGSGVFVYDFTKFEAANMAAMAAKYGVTTFCAPPTVYRFLIKEDLSQYDFSNLKYAVTAGEPLNPEVYERFKEYTGLRLMEGYGQTELTITAATFVWEEPKPGSMGKPSPGYDLKLLNLEDKECDAGEQGEIVIDTLGGDPVGLFCGYRGDPQLTESAWHDGYYRTGDIAWMDEDGFLWFVGRADDVIKSSGYKIGPFEVESALMEHGAVLECAITGVPDPVRGQVVKATIVLAKGYEAGEELKKELQNHVKRVTAPYKYPRIVEFVSELPKTISGKIRRVEIREKDGGKS